MDIREFSKSYDWQCAVNESSRGPDPVPGYAGNCKWGMDDIESIPYSSEGENDGLDWIAVLYLKDERYVFMSAGCDYTGWDCQAGGRSLVSDDVGKLIDLGITLEEKERLQK